MTSAILLEQSPRQRRGRTILASLRRYLRLRQRARARLALALSASARNGRPGGGQSRP